MSEHTPGPWHVGTLPPPTWRYICGGDGETIAAVAEWDDQGNLTQEFTDKAQANARLIAAAPELLEALKECSEQLALLAKDAFDNPWVQQARAAIAKAEGR